MRGEVAFPALCTQGLCCLSDHSKLLHPREEGSSPQPLGSLCLTLPVPTGVPEPRVHPCHHEADVLPPLPGHGQRQALQQLLPQRGEGLPGQPGRSQHGVEVPDG